MEDAGNPAATEWRAHYHVPIFTEDYGHLQSTQTDIKEVLELQKRQSSTAHLEIETYTWEVLPKDLKLPFTGSIIRELHWVQQLLQSCTFIPI